MRAKITCMRCGKFWFADEPELEPLCPICEDAYQEWIAADAAAPEVEGAPVDETADPVEPEGG